MEYTAESVTPRHPDKMCDRISDAILDECLKQDPDSRVAIETMGGHGIVTITGELTTRAFVDIREIVRRIAGNVGVQINIVKQSPEIAQGVDIGGAGDQGIMIGYACNENEQKIPQEFYVARELCKAIYKEHPIDGKTQVTRNDGGIKRIVASFQGVSKDELLSIIDKELPGINESILSLNPAGEWNMGGFDADTGVTGRKIVVDAYGPRVPVGGGAFSGKDPSKVDRSGAYIARKVALELLKDNKEVVVKVAYAISKPEPEMAVAWIDGNQIQIDKQRFMPRNIIKELNLKQPIYEETAEWGAFGGNQLWEKK